MKTKKVLFFLFSFLAVGVGFYPLVFLASNTQFPILNGKSQELLGDVIWNISFYSHISLGGVALLIGWSQFSKKLRNKYLQLHRLIGKIYVGSVLLSAIGGIYIGFFAAGGIISKVGFISLGIIWFYTTLKAFLEVKKGRIEQHKKMMIYSYAACFAAVTLRLLLPLLIVFFHEFVPAYQVVAWLCWVPNLLVAHFIILKKSKDKIPLNSSIL
ncbi:MAG: DUF2306 domain-containing protein [Saprospiraceae bacterium]